MDLIESLQLPQISLATHQYQIHPLKAGYLNTDLATGLLQSVFRNLGLALWETEKSPCC